MGNKKVSELPSVNTLNDNDIFVLDHQGSTGTVTFDTIASKVSGSSIPKPTGLAVGNNGNVLTYQHSTTSWIASAANFIPKPTTTSADNGKVLTYQHSTTSWVASSRSTITIPGASLAKAWVSFVGSTGTIISSYNVTSITRRGLGLYTINFKTGTFTDDKYLYTFGVQANVAGNDSNVIGRFGTKTVNSIQISCDDDNGSDNNDFPEICIVFYASGGDIVI